MKKSMDSSSYIEYGVICDRTKLGLGKILLATSRIPNQSLFTHSYKMCYMDFEHSHEMMQRAVTVGEWMDIPEEETSPP